MAMSFSTMAMPSRRNSEFPPNDKFKMATENRQVMPMIIEPPPEFKVEDFAESGNNSHDTEIKTLVDDSALGDLSTPTQQGSRKVSVCTFETGKSTNSEKSNLSSSKQSPHFAIRDVTTATTPSPPSEPSPHDSSYDRTNHTRRRMRRQLHLIFIYPIMYIALWIPPLILYLMGFSSKYKSGLPPALAVTSTMCLTLMGGIDSVVFLLREKPWRRRGRLNNGLRGNNGSLSYDTDAHREEEEEEDIAAPTSNAQFPSTELTQVNDNPERSLSLAKAQMFIAEDQPSPLPTSSLFRKVVPRAKTSTSDSQSVARELAYERLALETAERKLSCRSSEEQGSERKYSGRSSGDNGGKRSSSGAGMGSPSSGTREWWDRKDSIA
jgi:hypothetical protein